MKNLNKLASLFCLAVLGVFALTSCEGGELYNVGAPDWISAKADSIKQAQASSVVVLTPNPEKLGADDNTTPWWTVFTDDIKLETGKTYQIPFTNYGGSSNWNNFVIILRNEAKDFEYGVFRADNWGWGTGWAGEELAEHCDPSGGQTDWAAWLKAMNRAECVATLVNNGDGTADIKVTMVGSDGVTYKQNYLNIIGINKDDLYFSFTVDNCHLVFGTPTEQEDSQPASLTLSNVPSKVLQGSDISAFANISAQVKFENGLSKTVEAGELEIQAVPDMTTLGSKTLVAVYNKTYLGENSSKAVIGQATFSVVDKMFTCIGKSDNSSGFREEKTENFKVEPGHTYVNYFTNYSDKANNWDNFIITLVKGDGTEYCFVRADNWGTGTSYWDGCQSCDYNWDNFRDALDGARVTTYITNNGDGTADVVAVIGATDGNIYTQKYTGLKDIDANDMYFYLSIEKAHLEFDCVIGAEDNSSAFRAETTPDAQIGAGETVVNRFINHSDKANNWDNFIITLKKSDGTEYCFVRADNWGTGTSYWDGCQSCDYNWDNFRDSLDGATVTTYITNNGDGTADVVAVVNATDGNTYTQKYIGLKDIDASDLYYNLSMEKAHLVFE